MRFLLGSIFSLLLMINIFTGIAQATEGEPLEDKLTIERIFSSPELAGQTPTGLAFSPDGKRLTFLKGKVENYEIMDLWEYDLKTGAEKLLVDSKQLNFGELSEEEKARRERQRNFRQGIAEYYWSKLGRHLVFPASGDLFLYTFARDGKSAGQLKRLTHNKSAEIDVKFSPQDHYLSYVRDQNLYVLDLKTGREMAVTREGRGAISYGTAEFIAQEEMDRDTGYWWSEDEKYIAFTRVDESKVKIVKRYDIDADKVTVREDRYPEAGSVNATVKLAWTSLSEVRSGKRNYRWAQLPPDPDYYIPNVAWSPAQKLAYQVMSRDQKTLDVFLLDPKTNRAKKLLTERDKHWVNISSWKWLKNGQWIWESERTGFSHFYLYQDDRLIRALTEGSWPATYAGVDEEEGWLFVTGWNEDPRDQNLYRAPLAADKSTNPAIQRLSPPGWSNFQVSKDGKYFVRASSSPVQPWQTYLHKANGEQVAAIAANEVKAGHPLFQFRKNMVEPEYGYFQNKSGDTIYFRLFKPKDFRSSRKYPLIVQGYGGPGPQLANKSWSTRYGLLPQVYAQNGFVVAIFDNRGGGRRGRAFSDALYRAFGTVEVEDQVAGVQHLVQKGFVDPKRVGFYGHSYGGYLSLLLATKAPDVYAANVASAPVTDFSLYDTHYTERFLGKPQDEKEVYARANVLNFVNNVKGRILVLHGMADDNVLFTNSTMLFKKLQENGKIYESITYPGAKHGISGKTNDIHVHSTILDFFRRNLRDRE